MMKRLVLTFVLGLVLASGLFYTPAEASSSAQAVPAVSGVTCQASSSGGLTIYTRPSLKADVFSKQPPGFSQQMSARAKSGWLGFDPGIAQAANIGVFRLRWVQRKDVKLSGNCGDLPKVWAPPPGICFDMPMETVKVYQHPDTTSSLVTALRVGDFAAVRQNDGTWAKVDLRPGNTGVKKGGWVQSNTLNVNGRCP